ncbi:RagB/SusD family nutrient uptake outer membrane protein [Pedobacter puniceum]|jgi:hypothetical protein|uniref:RagB/SusD family nutrient uptake outer membrane protein n=1 Tax=Pedobacter puniceum TaxID=2666136 RepID=A0A7K0FPQ6_9SPHI|nr:RagB/SusD family nutrient uptake outer membrane protein [Pedobacter puniceum]MRX47863.1 RagB/SusD family nutrient uptake outer membrane protein [Pedobacter puniceum]
MKKINYLILFIAATLFSGAIGCNVIEKDPISSIEPGQFFKNRNDANAFMAGIYNSLQTTLRNNYFDWGEVRSDNVEPEGTGTAQTKLVNNALAANDNDLNAVTNWSDLYRTISLCNMAIEVFPDLIARNVDAASDQYRDQLGQAYALRGLMYFYALRVWGRVPIVNEVVTRPDQQLYYPRAPIDSVKAQILSDIDKSLQTIGNTTNKFYIQRQAVFAFKTDVHMWFQEYQAAVDASSNITGYSFITNPAQWKTIFVEPESSSETIFNLFWNSAERNNQGVGVCARLGSRSNTSNYKIRPAVVANYYNRQVNGRKVDARLWLSVDTIESPNVVQYDLLNDQYGKFMTINSVTGQFNYINNNDCSVRIPIYRYADVMLLRAEALARLNRFTEALAILNQVRSRVGFTVQAQRSDYTGTDEQVGIAIQRTILLERQLELIGEGKRWFDLCRIGRTYDFTSTGYDYLRSVMNPILQGRTGGVAFDTDLNMGRILYPINSDIINANPLLRGQQNPPYSE